MGVLTREAPRPNLIVRGWRERERQREREQFRNLETRFYNSSGNALISLMHIAGCRYARKLTQTMAHTAECLAREEARGDRGERERGVRAYGRVRCETRGELKF